MASASPLSPTAHQTFKFPAFQPDHLPTHEEEPYGQSSSRSPSPNPPHASRPNANLGLDRWQARRDSAPKYWSNGNPAAAAGRHARQKSLNEAWKTIRAPGRRASVTQNAHEIADALKAPVSPKLIVRHLEALGMRKQEND
jgi:solute carrier family 35 protein E1